MVENGMWVLIIYFSWLGIIILLEWDFNNDNNILILIF